MNIQVLSTTETEGITFPKSQETSMETRAKETSIELTSAAVTSKLFQLNTAPTDISTSVETKLTTKVMTSTTPTTTTTKLTTTV
jgi:hypothetical protein